MSDGILYLVTNYSNYSAKPLEKEADLDSYVPAYYIDDVKYYVKAEDNIIPSDTATAIQLYLQSTAMLLNLTLQ